MQQETAGTTGIDAAKTEAADAGKPGEAARKTLAMRIAHRNRLRAERLARLRAEPVPEPAEMAAPEASPPAPSPEMTPEASTAAPSAETPSREMAETPIPKPAEQAGAAPAGKTVGEAEDNAAALEEFLKALSQGSAAPASQAVADDPEPASVLPFQRPPEAELAAAMPARGSRDFRAACSAGLRPAETGRGRTRPHLGAPEGRHRLHGRTGPARGPGSRLAARVSRSSCPGRSLDRSGPRGIIPDRSSPRPARTFGRGRSSGEDAPRREVRSQAFPVRTP